MKEQNFSTPLDDVNEDNLLLSVADTLSADEPAVDDIEPLSAEDKAEKHENDALIFGKFKTIEEAYKGYKEAEKAITKSAELEKQIKQYQDDIKLFEQDRIAYENGFSNRFDMALNADAWHHEIDNYALAARYTLSPQQQIQMSDLIQRCYQFGNNEDIAQLRKCFSPEIVALISQDTETFRNSRKKEYEEMLLNDNNIRYNRKLDEFKLFNDNWIDSDIKTDLIRQAIEVSNGNVNLHVLKDFVDKIEHQAIEKYLKKNNANQENDLVQNSLVEPSDYNIPKSKKKKWLTKKDYYKLTPQEEAEKYDLIVEQVKLEKEGLLPRMLT